MKKEHRERQRERRRTSGEALRKAGYVPIPRWWVLPDELSVIHRMAHNHQDHINEIRARVLGRKKDTDDEDADAYYD